MHLWPMQVIMRVELLYGLAGLVGSLVSGHLFLLFSSSLGNGTILLIVSILLHLLSLIHSIVLLRVSIHVCGSNTSQICFLCDDLVKLELLLLKVKIKRILYCHHAALSDNIQQ